MPLALTRTLNGAVLQTRRREPERIVTSDPSMLEDRKVRAKSYIFHSFTSVLMSPCERYIFHSFTSVLMSPYERYIFMSQSFIQSFIIIFLHAIQTSMKIRWIILLYWYTEKNLYITTSILYSFIKKVKKAILAHYNEHSLYSNRHKFDESLHKILTFK